MAAYIKEPEIRHEDILKVADGDFNIDHVCIVTGAGSGIGRATAIAASANNLMTVGLDVDAAAGKKTQQLARKMGGQMIFIKTDLTKDADQREFRKNAWKFIDDEVKKINRPHTTKTWASVNKMWKDFSDYEHFMVPVRK